MKHTKLKNNIKSLLGEGYGQGFKLRLMVGIQSQWVARGNSSPKYF
jgi:hypothetical protein